MANYLDVLLPGEPDALIGAAARRRIAELAAFMLPIPRIAVECRLAEGDDQVDLQQCIRRDDGEYSALADHSASLLAAFPRDAALVALKGFCAELARDHSLLRAGIEEIFLEYDLPKGFDARNAAIVPALFFSLPEDARFARQIVIEAMSRLRTGGSPASPRMIESIERCFAACETASLDASLSNIGVMLGRGGGVVRVNVKRLRPSEVDEFLAQCEWPGDRGKANRLVDDAANSVDRVTLALDVGETLLPRIGVECFLDEQPARDPTWIVNFNDLQARRLCSPSKATAFLAIPDDLIPTNPVPPWPGSAIVASLIRGESDFSTFARRAVHFKITEAMDRAPEAKAYFGAGHLWRSATAARDANGWQTTTARARRRRSVVARDRIAEPPAPYLHRAIARGISFLLHRQLQSGLWRDFNLPPGISDEWVSGFVGAQLAATGDAHARAASRECYERLVRRQRANGGWGYNRDHPPDADSSSWALRLAVALGHHGDGVFRRGADFVAKHSLESGGVACYVETFRMAAHARLPSDVALSGLLHVHDCVTAAAVPFLPERAVAYLRSQQRDGHWVGYFWVHDAYVTAFAVEALRARPVAGDAERLAAAEACAMRWLDGSSTSSDRGATTAFDASFCVRVLSESSDAQALNRCREGVDWLLAEQQPDGGWTSGARLRMPLSGSPDPLAGVEHVTLDYRGVFTTAAVVGALSAFRDATEPQGDQQ